MNTNSMMNNPELMAMIRNADSTIKEEQGKLIHASYMLGAASSVEKLHTIFSTLDANVDNDKLSDKDFRMLTGQFLETLNKLHEEQK